MKRTLTGRKTRPWMETVGLSPPRLLILGYAALIALGTVLLKLPIAVNTPLSWTDALFTSASAVTVTGLVAVDTGSHFTTFGHVVIAALIQLGGLGLMTFAVMIFMLLGLRMPMRQQLALSEDLNQTNLGSLFQLVVMILKLVLLMELIGVVLLAARFIPEFGMITGLWHAVFHAISAFNNAGFCLYPDSLMRFAGDPIINFAVPALFIAGGLGFSVLYDIKTKRRWRTLTLHSKLMLTGSLALAIWGFAAIAVLEWSNPRTLGSFDNTSTKMMAAWFQSLTPRSAGFNTIDIAGMTDSSTLLVITLMVIGGGSTSTAGGIKVTSFIVLILATIAFLRRRDQVSVFGRSLSSEQIMKVLALTSLYLAFLITGIFLVTLTNALPILDIVFEVTSAFATSGLSRGATAELDTFGKLVLVLYMFIGRIGPLALGFLLATAIKPRVRYPGSQIYIG
jgi:trk system potassium uptake protein